MIPKIAFLLTFTWALVIASGCATPRFIASTPCKGLDWFEIGRRDGAIGKPVDALKQHIVECSKGEFANADLYLNGRNAGLVDFCTKQSGFEVGRAGTQYMAACPEHLEKQFLPGYEQGRRVFHQEEMQTTRLRSSQRL